MHSQLHQQTQIFFSLINHVKAAEGSYDSSDLNTEPKLIEY